MSVSLILKTNDLFAPFYISPSHRMYQFLFLLKTTLRFGKKNLRMNVSVKDLKAIFILHRGSVQGRADSGDDIS